MPRREPKRAHAAILVRQDDSSRWQADVVRSITMSHDWLISDHPLEDGSVVTDHVQKQPATIVLSVTLTENPVRIGAQIGGRAYLRQQIEWLTETADAGQLVDVVTRRLGIFRNYAIQTLPVLIDKVSRLAFDLTLREIKIATATTVEINVETAASDVATGAPDEIDAGEQATTSTEVDPVAEASDQSILSSLLDAL